jgi:hypothetical protein
LSQLGELSCPALSKAACFAEGRSIVEHAGHIGAATLAIITTQRNNDAANFRKRASRVLIVPALYLDSRHPLLAHSYFGKPRNANIWTKIIRLTTERSGT